ncbi:hypothetical protein Tco_1483085 [Tanacetum coccineum]
MIISRGVFVVTGLEWFGGILCGSDVVQGCFVDGEVCVGVTVVRSEEILLVVYGTVHDNDASEERRNHHGEMCTSGRLIDLMLPWSTSRGGTWSEVYSPEALCHTSSGRWCESASDRDVGLRGKSIHKLRIKGVYEESFSRHAA